MRVLKLDHLVLTVADLECSASFYESVLGMERQLFANGRIALRFGEQKINLHKYQEEFEPKALHPTPGSADLCFITDTDLDEAMAHVRRCGVDIIEGPVERTGASGPLRSFYFRDPDMNLVEVGKQISAKH